LGHLSSSAFSSSHFVHSGFGKPLVIIAEHKISGYKLCDPVLDASVDVRVPGGLPCECRAGTMAAAL